MQEPRPIPPPALHGMEGWEAHVAWSFVPEATTWRLEAPGGEVRYVKVARLGREPGLRSEGERTVWAAAHLPPTCQSPACTRGDPRARRNGS